MCTEINRLAVYENARINKDRHYDGQFFFAVKTTNIFCRPSCPSPIAKKENVTYYETMFDALNHGYRPCRRCRPDVNVEYYNGNVDGAELVNKALGMIYDGYLNEHSLGDMAGTLGVTDRHLRNLFNDNIGMPPVKVAAYHRVLFAKKLLVYSDISVTDVAYASGFGSTRQFNDVFKDTFGQTPTEVRGVKINIAAGDSQTNLIDTKISEDGTKQERTSEAVMKIPYEEPFDYEGILSFVGARAIKGVEVVGDGTYQRTFRIGEAKGISDYLGKDPLLIKGMKDGLVPRLPVAFNTFEFIIRAILGQQITVKAATTLAGRIAERFGMKVGNGYPDGLECYFPGPEELKEMSIEGLGITGIRQNTIRTVTEAVVNGTVSLSRNQSYEQFRNDFIALKGIGSWTVNYVAMRGLGMMDSFPAKDLGVIKALMDGDRKPSEKEILKRAEGWQPYRAYAALCLWYGLSN